MLIPYKPFLAGERLPFVTLTLKGPSQEIIVDAFVDSGADFSIFHAGWMDDLKLSRTNGIPKKIQVGDGDYIQAYQFNIEVEFYGYKFIAPVTFSDRLGPGFNLLGRKGFFERFRFCFDDKHFRLTISRL